MRKPIPSDTVKVSDSLVKSGGRAHAGFSVTRKIVKTGAKATIGGVRVGAKSVNLASQHMPLNASSEDVQKTLQSDVQSAMRAGASKSAKVGRTTYKATKSTARLTARTVPKAVRTGAKAAKASVRTASRTAQAAASAARIVAAGISRAMAAIISLTSSPVGVAVVVIAVVIGMLMSILSWLPGVSAANQQQTTQASSSDFPIIDDYPYKGHYNDGVSPLGYEYGNCTDFVAWRMNRDAGDTSEPWKLTWAQLTPHGGNGGQWGLPGNLPGWTTVSSPSAGDIISIPAGVAVLGASGGPYGHVAYIADVTAEKVTIENYGRGKYFLTSPTLSQLAGYVEAHQAVIRHDPANTAAAGGDAKAYAKRQLDDDGQYECLLRLWDHESGWRVDAENTDSGAYGIPQALPGSKMASMGSDWKTNPITQIKWGLSYIRNRPDYGSPCAAWALWQSRSPHWY